MMFQMVGVFAELERSMISDRVKLGLERVRKEAKKLGPVDDQMIETANRLHEEGKSITEIAQQIGVSRPTVYRMTA